jgi:hypothetical protein
MRDWNEEAQVQQACCRDAVSKQYVMQRCETEQVLLEERVLGIVVEKMAPAKDAIQRERFIRLSLPESLSAIFAKFGNSARAFLALAAETLILSQ